jgi:DNA-binding transcriptional LysR family regulator
VLAGDCIGLFGSYIARLSSASKIVRELSLPDFGHDRRVVAVHSPAAGSHVEAFIRVCERFYEGSKVAQAV